MNRSALREAALAYFLTTVACAILWQLRALLGAFLQLGIAGVLILVPRWLIDRRQAAWSDYGLGVKPVGRGLLWSGVAALVFLPTFFFAYGLYYEVLCRFGASPCRTYLGFGGVSPRFPPDYLNQALGQIIAISLPEEFFYRGYLQGRLSEVFPSRWRVLGTLVGPAWLIQAFCFGLAHVFVDGHVVRLATFFPALVFGWLRQRTGSILAPTLFHAACNLWAELLFRSFFAQ